MDKKFRVFTTDIAKNDLKDRNRFVVSVRKMGKNDSDWHLLLFCCTCYDGWVRIADLLNLDIDPKPNGRISYQFRVFGFYL
ncbi:MAG: hypothetical protein NHB15_17170 [Methanosarcina barkeri]|nr:hypothetical protein [Methanosarcina sp. ERenArc_MAG2]